MQLEEELGVTLFRRSKHRIILTEDGMLLRRRAEEIVSLAEKTRDDLRHKQDHLAGTIAVGSGELQSSRFLTQLIAAFQKENPLVSFRIYSGNSDNIKERIERGLLDIGLLQEPVDIAKYHFVRTPMQEQWGVLVRADAELAAKDRVSPADLAGLPSFCRTAKMCRTNCSTGSAPLRRNCVLRPPATCFIIWPFLPATAGSCVLTLNLACHYDGLRFIPLAPELESGTVLVWKKAQTFSPAAAAFIAYSKEYISGII